jgi:hypothetical protein
MIRPQRRELRDERWLAATAAGKELLDDEGQELQRRRVAPLKILEYQKHRTGRRETFELAQQRREGTLLEALCA